MDGKRTETQSCYNICTCGKEKGVKESGHQSAGCQIKTHVREQSAPLRPKLSFTTRDNKALNIFLVFWRQLWLLYMPPPPPKTITARLVGCAHSGQMGGRGVRAITMMVLWGESGRNGARIGRLRAGFSARRYFPSIAAVTRSVYSSTWCWLQQQNRTPGTPPSHPHPVPTVPPLTALPPPSR